jgi:hypothetical protein
LKSKSFTQVNFNWKDQRNDLSGELRMKSLRLLSVFLLFVALPVLPLHATETGTFERTLQVSGPVDLDIMSGAGTITIHTGGNNSLRVYAAIRARDSWYGLSAQEKIKKLQANPPIEQQGNSIHIGRTEDHELRQNVSIDYDLTVPAQTKVTCQTGSGDQVIDGVQLAVNAHTGSGNITVTNIGAGVRARTGSGNLRLTSVNGFLDGETGSGDIHANGIAGDVTVNTGSGQIEVQQVAKGNVRASAGSGTKPAAAMSLWMASPPATGAWAPAPGTLICEFPPALLSTWTLEPRPADSP